MELITIFVRQNNKAMTYTELKPADFKAFEAAVKAHNVLNEIRLDFKTSATTYYKVGIAFRPHAYTWFAVGVYQYEDDFFIAFDHVYCQNTGRTRRGVSQSRLAFDRLDLLLKSYFKKEDAIEKGCPFDEPNCFNPDKK